MIDFIKDHWIVLLFGLLAFVEIVIRLTPTKKDDSILNFIMKIVNFLIPNHKRNSGLHKPK